MISYYEYEDIPCQVTRKGHNISAEGYFPGEGLRAMPSTPVLFHGIPLTKREFQALVVAQRKK